MRKIFTLLCAATLVTTVAILGCKKENKSGETDLHIHLTDNPFNATEVNVDIQEVRVKFSDDATDEGWINLPTHRGIYNLLDYQAGIDTLLAQATVPTGVLKEIRFVLGSRNSILIENNLYPLTIPSGSESGLKIKLNQALNGPIDFITIDFDAALSIHQTGNGEYKLKPVLKIR